MSAIKFGLEWT